MAVGRWDRLVLFWVLAGQVISWIDRGETREDPPMMGSRVTNALETRLKRGDSDTHSTEVS
jgi:hypothetical protein